MFSARRPQRRSPFHEIDLVLWGIPLAMTFLAGILIASTQRQAEFADWYQHWITGGVGLVLAALLSRVPLERLRALLLPIYGLTVVSLISVRLIGTYALGAQRWINIGGFHVQPSEFAKLGAILLLAGVLSRYPIERPVDLIRPTGVFLIPWTLVFLEPNLGTSLVFAAVLLVMMFWAGMPLGWVVLLLSPLVAAILAGTLPPALVIWLPLMGLIAYRSLPWRWTGVAITLAVQGLFAAITPYLWMHGLKAYQRDRLVLFLDPSKDPLGGGYHLLQSKIGIGSGGLWGTGLMHGQLTKLRFIPEQHTDFIFSALGEELGFVGAMLLLLGFGVLMWRLLQIAGKARTDFESLVVIGVGAMVLFQVVVNINMTIGLGPVTGIPLPWMSYGRSSLLVNFLALGLCASVNRHSRHQQSHW
ncbi:MAG: rod shape-determining protein RodA [Cyanobium sp.]|nr:rod shape-determining protein RodA [Synechococcus sp. CS-1333]MCT0210853.1 rod shape-determining protein RodA [Synechococcus sp. CS-1333]PZV24527.1 MAG: rod shape-determining protein RodA [Cyanobium sp.]